MLCLLLLDFIKGEVDFAIESGGDEDDWSSGILSENDDDAAAAEEEKEALAFLEVGDVGHDPVSSSRPRLIMLSISNSCEFAKMAAVVVVVEVAAAVVVEVPVVVVEEGLVWEKPPKLPRPKLSVMSPRFRRC